MSPGHGCAVRGTASPPIWRHRQPAALASAGPPGRRADRFRRRLRLGPCSSTTPPVSGSSNRRHDRRPFSRTGMGLPTRRPVSRSSRARRLGRKVIVAVAPPLRSVPVMTRSRRPGRDGSARPRGRGPAFRAGAPAGIARRSRASKAGRRSMARPTGPPPARKRPACSRSPPPGRHAAGSPATPSRAAASRSRRSRVHNPASGVSSAEASRCASISPSPVPNRRCRSTKSSTSKSSARTAVGSAVRLARTASARRCCPSRSRR